MIASVIIQFISRSKQSSVDIRITQSDITTSQASLASIRRQRTIFIIAIKMLISEQLILLIWPFITSFNKQADIALTTELVK